MKTLKIIRSIASVLLSTAIVLGAQISSANVIFEIEFLPSSDIEKSQMILNSYGFNVKNSKDKNKLVIEGTQYNETLQKLTPVVISLPDVQRLSWKKGSVATSLYQTPEVDLFSKDLATTDSVKVVRNNESMATMTLVMRDEMPLKAYYDIASALNTMGYRVSSIPHVMSGGWVDFVVLTVDLPNNVKSFREATLKFSEIYGIDRLIYNQGGNPNINNYTLTFTDRVDMNSILSRLISQGIEVYKVDAITNTLFIHFPIEEVRNRIKLEQIKKIPELVMLTDLKSLTAAQFTRDEYLKNQKHIWLNIPTSVQKTFGNKNYVRRLYNLAQKEAERLKAQGMTVLHYGVHYETGEIFIPEVNFTYRNKDIKKAETILASYEKYQNVKVNPYGQEALSRQSSCSRLF